MISVEELTKVILSCRTDISNKKLQKLAYYVYAWYLTIYGLQIADLTFEAWEHGPVSRTIYNRYRQYGWSVIPQYVGFVLVPNDKIKFIKGVIKYYGKFDADTLEKMTHNEMPWINARKGYSPHEASDAVILPKDMVEYYSQQKEILSIISDEIR